MKTYPLAYQNQQHQLKIQPKLKQQRRKGLLQRNAKIEKHHKVYKEETDVALVVGRAAWWIPVLAINNNMRNLTFAEALKDFLQNCSFHCYGKLVETGRRYQERLFWLVFHIAALSTLILYLWHHPNSSDQLLRTTVYQPVYSPRAVPYPAVSICSINRISNASATRYAEFLSRKDPEQRHVKFFYDMIKMLKYNYDDPIQVKDYNKALKFQLFLDLYDREENELFYDTRSRMAMLTPKCSEILQQCRLIGENINCAEVFEETFTSWGLCCTFNKKNKYTKGRRLPENFSAGDITLNLVLYAPQKDNFFKIYDLDGFIIAIYPPFIHPNPNSGRVEETLALTGFKSCFGIKMRQHSTVKEARIYKPKARNCLFHDELPKIYGNKYNFNNCITQCRLHSVFVLCGCYPFHTSFENKSATSDMVICSLQHKQCLMRYDFKWLNVITQRQNIPGLEREMEDALYCPDCLPSCAETQYKVQQMTFTLNAHNINLSAEQDYSDLAVVNIYLEAPNALYYRRVLVNSWFEVFGNIGNICGVIAGFSLIGICEVLFFFIGQLITTYKKEALYDVYPRDTAADQTLQILP